MDQLFLQKLTEVIEANYSDPSFGAKNLERELGISHSNLFRKVRSLTGKSINKLISEVRLHKALEMLKSEDRPISDIAARSGFSSSAYFSTSFRKYFGFSPLEAQKMGQEGQGDQKGQGDTGLIGFAQGSPPLPGAERTALTPTPTPTPTSGVRWIRSKWVGALFVIILAGIIISIATTRKPGKDISVAVLPFRSLTQNATAGNLSEILWEQVITTLAQIEVFNVRSAASSGQYRNTAKLVPAIGKELKVQYIIEGSVSQEGDQVKLWVQLIDTKTDNHFWAEEYTFNESDLLNKMLDFAEHVAYQLKTGLKPGERSAILLKCSKSDESIENCLQGNYWMNFERGVNPLRALPFYRKAIELDSTWVSPYFRLAEALAVASASDPKEEYFEERLRAIEKANRLIPGLTSRLALAKYYLDIRETRESRKIFQKLLLDYPDNQNIHFHLGKAFRNFDRWKEALKLQFNAQQANPESVQTNYGIGQTYSLTRDFPKALFFINQGISVNPNFTINYYGLSEIALKWKGDTSEAREILENAIKRNPWGGNDPIRASYLFILADIFDGRYEEAINHLPNWIFDVPGNHPPPYNYHSRPLFYAWIYGYQGKPQLAHDYYDSTRILLENRLKEFSFHQKRPEVISSLGMAYAGLGDTVRALEMAGRVGDLLSANPDGYFGPVAMEDVAWIHAKTGNHREALKIIRRLLSKPGPLSAKLLEIDPKWSMLKDEPGFKRLIDRYTIEVVDVSSEMQELADKKPIVPIMKGPSFTDDRDGKVYHFRKIGDQVWMTENLAYLPDVSPPDTGSCTEKHYYVWGYAGTRVEESRSTDNYRAYGVLYNWEAALTACPGGWHLPTDDEWKTLEKHLGMSQAEADYTLYRYSGAVGKKMRAKAGWPPNSNGKNSARFYAIPGGNLYTGTFHNLGRGSAWWSSSEAGQNQAIFRAVVKDEDGVFRNLIDKRSGFSIRCVRD